MHAWHQKTQIPSGEADKLAMTSLAQDPLAVSQSVVDVLFWVLQAQRTHVALLNWNLGAML